MVFNLHGLYSQPERAADMLKRDGWTCHEFTNSKGEHCMHDALLKTGLEPGDGSLASIVFSSLGYTFHWNDQRGRKVEEVLEALRTVRISPYLLQRAFGNEYEALIELIRTIHGLSDDQVVALLSTNVWALSDLLRKYESRPDFFDSDSETSNYENAYYNAGRAAAAAWNSRTEEYVKKHGVDILCGQGGHAESLILSYMPVLAHAVAARSQGDIYTPAEYDEVTELWSRLVGPAHPVDLMPEPSNAVNL